MSKNSFRSHQVWSCLMLGKIEGRRKEGWQKMRWVGVITNSNGHESEKLWEIVKDRETWHAAIHGVAKSWTQLSDWTTKILISLYLSSLLRKVLLSWLALPLDLFPLYPPPCRKIPFPNTNTYSDLLPYRLCFLLDWNTKYSTPRLLLMRRMVGWGWRSWQPGCEWEGGSQTLRYRFRSCDLILLQNCNYHFTWSGNDRASLRS